MKPETSLFVGVLFYFLTIVLNRFLGERNYSSLAQEDKLKLTDGFSKHRSWATYLPIGIMLAVIFVGYLNPQTFRFAFPVGVLLVLINSLVVQILIFRKLKTLSLPQEYVSKFRVQSILVQIGNIVAMTLFAYGIVGVLS